ncbi:ogr/Delta-like zinc finger family protein [Zooshikella marina]|uniref:ogr/Delta-like zinc finger family protein n=1 Tax=Zooshikella ganghwensis TaxID=202772 RepID=UPI001BB0AA1E|nr:ogr/Delta-like zinc finger family protein [Zooshikella ganghwensis]MBU2707698.1 ogr/Delta-like zinc finger family protein [Zooshikella ganghwensis]
MQVNCPHCEHKAVIKSRSTLSKEVCDLYCQCKNTDCNHAFVMKLSFSHSLSIKPQATVNHALMALVQELTPTEKQQIAQHLMAS